MTAFVVKEKSLDQGNLFEAYQIREDGWILATNGKMFRREAVEILESKTELSYDEAQDLLILERKVERSFYEAGKALREIRDRALYRNLFPDFESYVINRFKCGKRYANYQIQASEVVDNIAGGNNCSLLPTHESQCRPLTQIEDGNQPQVWIDAISLAEGALPTAKQVKKAVKTWIENTRPSVPNPWKTGDVCAVIGDIPGRKKRWCIVSQANDFSCLCNDWEGEFQAKPEELAQFLTRNLQSKQEMRLLCDRMARLSQREGITRVILSQLGKIDRDFLTDEEERILLILEGAGCE